MPGYIKDEDSLATGIPNRTIGPETGAFGNAIATNKGGTAQGTNQDHESMPPPAAGLDEPKIVTSDVGEHRSFASGSSGAAKVEFPESEIEPVYQQIADGGDHFDHDKHLHEDDEKAERREGRPEHKS